MAKKVSFIIPVYNEEHTLERVLKSLMSLKYPRKYVEVVMQDGGSTDDSMLIVNRFCREYKNQIRVLPYVEPQKAVSRNNCIKASSGEYIFNWSGHAVAPPDFVEVVLNKFDMYQSMRAVGFPNISPVDENGLAKKIGCAYHGFFAGNGTGVFMQNTTIDSECIVDHVPFVCYHRSVFDEVGWFDPLLNYGQDAEFHLRMKQHGIRILFTPDVAVSLFRPRSLSGLFYKMYRYGFSRSQIIRKHRKSISWWHRLPLFGGLVGLVGLLLIMGGVLPLDLLFLGMGCYIVGCLLSYPMWESLVIYPVIHVGYMVGLLNGRMRI